MDFYIEFFLFETQLANVNPQEVIDFSEVLEDSKS